MLHNFKTDFMKNTTAYIFLIFSLLFFNCNSSNKRKAGSQDDVPKLTEPELAEAFQLTETNCFSCHSPRTSLEDRVAPPMVAVKKHYINDNTTQEEFTQDLSAFLKNPSTDISKMPNAVKRFNLMQKINLTDEQISKIAAFIYLSELEQPEWFENHYQEEKRKHNLSHNADTVPMEVGKNIAMQTKGVLGKNLLEAINSKGTENAISFCSTKAIPLTDSMSLYLNALIKRVSDKNRNPQNKANTTELAYIEASKSAISQGKTPKPELTEIGDKLVGYYPIMTDKMCLQCHGQVKTEVLPNTLSRLRKLYPNDLALGYKINELRGIWVVEMDKK